MQDRCKNDNVQIQNGWYFYETPRYNRLIPITVRVNCDKELFAAEGGVTGCHAVFLRP